MEEKQLEDFLPNKKTSYIKKFNNSNNTIKIYQEQVIECIKPKSYKLTGISGSTTVLIHSITCSW